MRTLVRPTYPPGVNFVILAFMFFIASFSSYEMFDVRVHNPHHLKNAFFGIVLVGVSVVLMTMIIWEEILFHIKVKEITGGLIFRNQRKKTKMQVLLFLPIPAIFTFVYQEYDLKVSHFMIWAAVCIVLPAIEIVVSGINSHRNYLKLTGRMIKYKNNKKEGCFNTKDIQNITVVKEKKFITKIQLLFANNDQVVIDLEEMHLHEFYDSIYKFIKIHYKHLLKETAATSMVNN
ncbi:MAG TPA: hypothetical protein VNW06_12910 [Cytophagaceae bacterium]|jgi:hypothetical protein|nr:hypothetical protein [Cytophagaceae bacterium]